MLDDIVSIIASLFSAFACYFFHIVPVHSLPHDLRAPLRLPANLVACFFLFVMRDRDFFLSPVLSLSAMNSGSVPTPPVATTKKGRSLHEKKVNGFFAQKVSDLREFSRFYPISTCLDDVKNKLMARQQSLLARKSSNATGSKKQHHQHIFSSSPDSSCPPSPVIGPSSSSIASKRRIGRSSNISLSSTLHSHPHSQRQQQQQQELFSFSSSFNANDDNDRSRHLLNNDSDDDDDDGDDREYDSDDDGPTKQRRDQRRLAAATTASTTAACTVSGNSAALTKRTMKTKKQQQQSTATVPQMQRDFDYSSLAPTAEGERPQIFVFPHLVVPFDENQHTASSTSEPNSVPNTPVFKLRKGIDDFNAAAAPFLSSSASVAATELKDSFAAVAAAAAGSSPSITPKSSPASIAALASSATSAFPASLSPSAPSLLPLSHDGDSSTDTAATMTTTLYQQQQQQQQQLKSPRHHPHHHPHHLHAAPSRGISRAPRKRQILALDLDETLIHSYTYGRAAAIFAPPPDFMEVVASSSGAELFHVFVRPHLSVFLRQAAAWFDLAVFTASTEMYAQSMVSRIDTFQVIRRNKIFSRADCTPSNAKMLTAGVNNFSMTSAASHSLSLNARQHHHPHRHPHHGNNHTNHYNNSSAPTYLKDLTKVDPDLSRVILLDNCPDVIIQKQNLLSVPDFLPIDDCAAKDCRAHNINDAACSGANSSRSHAAVAAATGGLIGDQRRLQESMRHRCQAVRCTALLDLLPILEALHHVHDVRAILQHRKGS